MSSSPTIATGNISLNGVVVSYQTVSGDNEWSLYITGARLNASSTSWYNATTKRYGYHKFILKRDSEVLVSVKSSKIPTKTNYGKSLKKKAANRNKSGSEFKSYLNTKYTSLVNKTIHSAATSFVNKVESDSASYDPNAAIINAELLYSVELKSTSQTTSLNLSVLGSTRNVPFSIPAKIGSGSGSGSGSGEEQTTTTEEIVDIDITSVNNGKNYVTNAQAYAKYGYIERVVDFSEVEDQNQLLKLAKIYAQNMQYDEMVLDISALDLHTLANNVNSLTLASNVRCISIPHGLDTYLPVTEIDIPLDDPAQVRYTLGLSGVGSMSSSTSSSAKLQGKRLSDKFTKISSNVLEVAIEHMSSVINQKTSGYVNIVQGENGSEAIVISSEPNWKTSHNLWKFDMNGLAYSDYPSNIVVSEESANNRTWRIGINMQGQIVADFINTGILSDGRDGQAARNYWNLDTGEFRLAAIDTVNSRIDNINSKVESVEYTPIGGANLLNDSDAPSLEAVTATKGRWFVNSGTTNDFNSYGIEKKASGDLLPTSANYITKISIKSNKQNVSMGLRFYGNTCMYLLDGAEYTMSCWAKATSGSAVIMFQYGNQKFKSATSTALTTSWKQYSYTFTFRLSDVSTNSNVSGAMLTFYIRSTSNAAVNAQMTSYKLERGKKATDWSKSDADLEFQTISSLKDSVDFSTETTNALNDALDRERVFNLLTNNGNDQCIQMDANGNLFINAEYIKAGTLSGTLLTATYISNTVEQIGNTKFSNKWDLRTGGTLTTYKADIREGKISGKLYTEDGYMSSPKSQNSRTYNYYPLRYNMSTGSGLSIETSNDVGYNSASTAINSIGRSTYSRNLISVSTKALYLNVPCKPTAVVGDEQLNMYFNTGKKFYVARTDNNGRRDFKEITVKDKTISVIRSAKLKKGKLKLKKYNISIFSGFICKIK